MIFRHSNIQVSGRCPNCPIFISIIMLCNIPFYITSITKHFEACLYITVNKSRQAYDFRTLQYCCAHMLAIQKLTIWIWTPVKVYFAHIGITYILMFVTSFFSSQYNFLSKGLGYSLNNIIYKSTLVLQVIMSGWMTFIYDGYQLWGKPKPSSLLRQLNCFLKYVIKCVTNCTHMYRV